MFKQIAAVTGMTIRSIPQRWGMSLATVLSIALVVGVLMAFMAMQNGFKQTLQGSGAENIAVILRKGSQAELNSVITRDQYNLISEAPGLWRNGAGKPEISGEMYVIVNGIKRATGTEANMTLRGVGTDAMLLRPGMTITSGRMMAPGTNELIVGAGVAHEFSGFELGKEIRLGSNTWKIVGTFTTKGSVFDSEIWTNLGVLQNLYQRGSSVQSIRARLIMPDGLKTLQDWAANEPQVDLDISTEKEFYAGQANNLDYLVKFLGIPLSIIMAIGALAGAWNTLYASVDARTRDIATLRTIGFSGFAGLIATMVEALLLSFAGGVIGAVCAYLLFNGMTAATLGSGFTQVVFAFSVTPTAILYGIGLSVIVGFLGSIYPAIRAARIPLLMAQ